MPLVRSRFKPRYKDYANMIQERAWHWARHSNVDFHALESEGYLVFHQCVEERPFDPAKSNGNFGGYFWTQLNLKFHSICFPSNKKKEIALSPEIAQSDSTEWKYFQFYSAVESLSTDAQQVVNMILENDYEELETLHESQKQFFRNGNNQRVYKEGYSRTCLRNHLAQKGWPLKKINIVFDEIKMSLAQL